LACYPKAFQLGPAGWKEKGILAGKIFQLPFGGIPFHSIPVELRRKKRLGGIFPGKGSFRVKNPFYYSGAGWFRPG